MPHERISPAILYWGTPVVLVTSANEDGSDNICPISAVMWLGHTCVLGFGAESKTPENILRSGECVVNLPDDTMVAQVNALATTTGTADPSPGKLARGYRFVKDKWAFASLTPVASTAVSPARILECPVHMECHLVRSHALMEDSEMLAGAAVAVELRVRAVHAQSHLKLDGFENRIDADKWRPMIMSFQHLFGLRSERLGKSVLARVDEEQYRPFTQR